MNEWINRLSGYYDIHWNKVAWESPTYYWVGIPRMCVVIFAVSYLFPKEPVRWTLAMLVGQFVSVVILGSSLALFPLVLLFLGICSLPQLFAGYVGAKLSKKMAPA